MRVGGNVDTNYTNPDEWIKLIHDLGYSAVIAPMKYSDSIEVKKDYLDCIKKNNLVIGEVGAWKNTLSTNEKERQSAIKYCKEQLSLADEISANCCVNIVGSRGEVWDGCYKENYSPDTYSLIIDSVREIIDAVKPQNTFYTLEPMPWMHPDSPDQYLKLINDIDRKHFAVHLDYTNMINSIDKYLNSTGFIKECFYKLAPYIKSVHAKDVCIGNTLPCCISEVSPGNGTIDFGNVLSLTEKLGAQTTLFLEHLNSHEEYKNSVKFIKNVAEKQSINIINIKKGDNQNGSN